GPDRRLSKTGGFRDRAGEGIHVSRRDDTAFDDYILHRKGYVLRLYIHHHGRRISIQCNPPGYSDVPETEYGGGRTGREQSAGGEGRKAPFHRKASLLERGHHRHLHRLYFRFTADGHTDVAGKVYTGNSRPR